jgi:hypothetical protein
MYAQAHGREIPGPNDLRMGCAYAVTHPWAPLNGLMAAGSADAEAFAREMRASVGLLETCFGSAAFNPD